MKRMLLLLLFIMPLFSLSGCSFFITATTAINDESIVDGTKFWFKKGTREQVSDDIFGKCFNKGLEKDLTMRGLNIDSHKYNKYKLYWYKGECLHDLGYVFKENIFSSYCYHEFNEEECQVFRNFKH